MGDYFLNPKSSSDGASNKPVVVKEELIAPLSPAQTVVQCGSRSPNEGPIRLRPLQTLTSDPSSRSQSQSDDDINDQTVALLPALPVPAIPSTSLSSDWNQWRSGCPSVRDKLGFILEKESFYQDVTFLVGKHSVERISAHKLILRVGSPVLERIMQRLTGAVEMRTTDPSAITDFIEIPEVEPFAFRYLLKFMYTDQFNTRGLKCSDIMTILQASRIFEVTELAIQCVQALKTHISDDTVIPLCEMGKDIEDFELRDMALTYICRNAKKVFYSTSFMDLSYANLVLLIANDELEWDELSIFKSVVRWADEFCRRKRLDPVASNLRGALGEIIYKVRFPLMTAEQFTFDVIPLKVLTSEEQVQIFKYLCLTDISTREQLEPTSFNCRRRNHMLNKIESSTSKDDLLLLKYKHDPSESPHCQRDLTSTDITTEGESEDASSQVSSDLSATLPKKRPRFRSPSPIASTTKHTELFGETPPKKSKENPSPKKRKSIDPDNTIEVNHGDIEFNQFVENCSTNPQRKEIESIKLSGVSITGHAKIHGKKVRFPKLKEFHIDINIPFLKHGEVNNLAGEISVENYLFFSIKVGKPKWFLKEIWSLGINISLVINGITLLKIDHFRKAVIVNKLKDCGKILASVQGDSGIRSLVVSQPKFPPQLDLFPSYYLERLVILSVDQIPEFNKFIRKFKKLRELCILSTDSKKVDLSIDLMSKEKLRKLAMGSTKFTVTVPVSLKCLEELFCWRCEWDSSLEENVPLLFPNLKKVSFYAGGKVTPKLLSNILKIKTVVEIGCGSFDWILTNSHNDSNGQVVKDILESAGLSVNDKSFVLTRIEDSKECKWTGKKGNFELSQEEIFKNFQFHHLYNDYQIFRS